MLPQTIAIPAILFVASLVQGAVGFASGMVAIPLLLVGGTPLHEAVAISAVASLMQNLIGVASLRREIPLRRTWRPVLVRLLALPFGIAALRAAGELHQAEVRQVVGVVMLGILLVQLVAPARPRRAWPVAIEWAAFLSSGLLLGFCGMGGPPVVMWAMAQEWTPAQTRGFLFFVFFSSMFPQIALLAYNFPGELGGAMMAGLWGMPLVLAGTYLGLAVGHRIERRRLRTMSFALLLAMAVYEITAPWWRS